MFESIPTPAIVVDAAIVKRNISRMAEYAKSHHLSLRPHTKTHKSKLVGKLQMDAGAIGLTVAKVGEAEVMSECCHDILMAYPSVGEQRCQRLAQLAGKITMRVGVDSLFAAEQLSAATTTAATIAGVLVDFDLGYGRTGVQSIDDSLELAQAIDKLPGLRLDGVMLYTGHVTGDTQTQASQFAELQGLCEQLLDRWKQAGLCCDLVSSGSTPSATNSHVMPAATEIRPGTYVYNDMNIVHGGYGSLEDCAARIHATVISNAVANQVVLDSGTKTLTSDRCGPNSESGHGYILEYPGAKIVKLTEEHAQVNVSSCIEGPRLGERVTIVPNHICVCINLQNHFWWNDAGELTQHLVDARGCLV